MVTIKKSSEVVSHVLRLLSSICSIFQRSGEIACRQLLEVILRISLRVIGAKIVLVKFVIPKNFYIQNFVRVNFDESYVRSNIK